MLTLSVAKPSTIPVPARSAVVNDAVALTVSAVILAAPVRLYPDKATSASIEISVDVEFNVDIVPTAKLEVATRAALTNLFEPISTSQSNPKYGSKNELLAGLTPST